MTAMSKELQPEPAKVAIEVSLLESLRDQLNKATIFEIEGEDIWQMTQVQSRVISHLCRSVQHARDLVDAFASRPPIEQPAAKISVDASTIDKIRCQLDAALKGGGWIDQLAIRDAALQLASLTARMPKPADLIAELDPVDRPQIKAGRAEVLVASSAFTWEELCIIASWYERPPGEALSRGSSRVYDKVREMADDRQRRSR